MKIYKNPWVSRESYFVKTGKAPSGRMEASKSKGYIIEFWDGKWEVREGQFYDKSLDEMPIIAEPKLSIKSIINNAILSYVLNFVEVSKMDLERKEDNFDPHGMIKTVEYIN